MCYEGLSQGAQLTHLLEFSLGYQKANKKNFLSFPSLVVVIQRGILGHPPFVKSISHFCNPTKPLLSFDDNTRCQIGRKSKLNLNLRNNVDIGINKLREPDGIKLDCY